MTRSLDVFANARRVGELEKLTTGVVKFRYDPEWLADEAAFPISLSLPLAERPYTGNAVEVVLDNMLPDEERVRKAVAARVGAAGTDPFSLLVELGRDCVGALQFLPHGEVSDLSSGSGGVEIDEEGIEELLRSLHIAPLGVSRSDDGFRISIAGAQDKTSLLQQDGKWFKPLGMTPSTHIIKPPIGIAPGGLDLSTSVDNEYLCLALARELGAETANVSITEFGSVRALVVERFDRSAGEGRLLRIPQEDVCQALGIPSFRKYEADGGPGMLTVLSLLEASDNPNTDREAFFRACFIFWLLGATDGHAKNFSITLGAGGRFYLTPLYDVMSLQPLVDDLSVPRREFRLAMAVGDKHRYRLEDVMPRHFTQTAVAAGLAVRQVTAWMEHLAAAVEPALERVKATLPSDFPTALLESVAEGAIRRSTLVTG